MKQEEIKRIVVEQFAKDYNCSIEDFSNKETIVTRKNRQQGARKFDEEDGILSMLSYNGKLIINADEKLIPWCEKELVKASAEWCFDTYGLLKIQKKLNEFGYGIEQCHFQCLPKYDPPKTNLKLQWYEPDEIAQFEEDERIDEAFLFDENVPDTLGVAALSENGDMLAIAGASGNSDQMWEIGVNSFEEGKGYGQAVVSALVEETLKRGKVPYYGTALSHCASLRIALKAGMVPSYSELRSSKL